MLGTTANAMANMGALVERYGPASRAYLVVPMVGAFFIDFINALLISSTCSGESPARIFVAYLPVATSIILNLLIAAVVRRTAFRRVPASRWRRDA